MERDALILLHALAQHASLILQTLKNTYLTLTNAYPSFILQALRGGRDSDMLEEMQMAMGECAGQNVADLRCRRSCGLPSLP